MTIWLETFGSHDSEPRVRSGLTDPLCPLACSGHARRPPYFNYCVMDDDDFLF
jgi:hypothetical protein